MPARRVSSRSRWARQEVHRLRAADCSLSGITWKSRPLGKICTCACRARCRCAWSAGRPNNEPASRVSPRRVTKWVQHGLSRGRAAAQLTRRARTRLLRGFPRVRGLVRCQMCFVRSRCRARTNAGTPDLLPYIGPLGLRWLANWACRSIQGIEAARLPLRGRPYSDPVRLWSLPHARYEGARTTKPVRNARESPAASSQRSTATHVRRRKAVSGSFPIRSSRSASSSPKIAPRSRCWVG